MDKKALRLESRFSISPNCLGYCGRESAANEFIACITKGECARVPEEVTKFIVLHPYLKTLSSITGLNFLSYPVIEGYWIGNKILNKAKPEDYDLLLDHFLDQGVPDFFVEELRQNKPRAFIPSHLFQVLHIGVGKASGAVPFNLESINNCMIRWGEITKLQKNKAIINLHSLKKDGNKYTL